MCCKVAGKKIDQRIIQFVNAAVFLSQTEIILDLIVLFVDTAGHLIGDAQEFIAVKAVVGKHKPKRDGLQGQETKKSKIPADEEKYITHGRIWKPTSLQKDTCYNSSKQYRFLLLHFSTDHLQYVPVI